MTIPAGLIFAAAAALSAPLLAAHGAVIGYFSDAACAAAPSSTVLAFTDVCLPEAGQQVAVVLTSCSASAVAGSLFAAPSMAAAPTCTGNAQVFAATAACAQVGASQVYAKVLDFTCASGGAAFVYALDTASAACASTGSASLVRYVPVLAGGACNAGGPEGLDVQVSASGSSVALSFFASKGGTCAAAGAAFAGAPSTGACTAAAGGAAAGIRVWAATCAMTLFAGFDVVGTRISTTMQPTETACAATCCAAAGCVAYSYSATLMSAEVFSPSSAVLSTSTAQTFTYGICNNHPSVFNNNKFRFSGPVDECGDPAIYTPVYSSGTLAESTLKVSGSPCVLMSNVTALVPSSLMTGGIIPAFLAAG
jgi:hypothetical protein